MSISLLSRVRRLEKQTSSGDPLRDLTDEELDARLEELTRMIEVEAGMSIGEYGEYLQKQLDEGNPPLDGMTIGEFKGFITSCRNLGKERTCNGQ